MRNRQLVHRGMTLVELLVVVAIIGLLLAVSVPILRPMLESRRTYNAAQILAGTFQQARMKSIQEGRSYGIKLVPFDTAPTVALQLQLQKEIPVDVINPLHIRVVVVDGEILPCVFDETLGWEQVTWDHPALVSVKDIFKPRFLVQFNRIGRFFPIDKNRRLKEPYHHLNLPEDVTSPDALEYRVTAMPVSTWLPPVVMPRGMIVDLVYSGGETVDFNGDPKTPDDVPVAFAAGDEVIVMFTPLGNVNCLYVNGIRYVINEMLYFCVGEWDRQVDADGNALAEDKKSNRDVPATYWVTLHPKTGEVRMTENAPSGNGSDVEKLHNARTFAREHFFNVGEN